MAQIPTEQITERGVTFNCVDGTNYWYITYVGRDIKIGFSHIERGKVLTKDDIYAATTGREVMAKIAELES